MPTFSRLAAAAALLAALAACGPGASPTPAPASPAATATPTATPSPTPAPTLAPTPTPVAALTACTHADVTVAVGHTSGAAGLWVVPITVTATHPCVISGFPVLMWMDSGGHQMVSGTAGYDPAVSHSTGQISTRPVTLITLHAGDKAYTAVSTDSDRNQCLSGSFLRMWLPDDGASQDLHFDTLCTTTQTDVVAFSTTAYP